MRNLFLFLFLLLAYPVISQDLKKQTKELGLPYSKEVFYVLKSDNTVKNGEYKKHFKGAGIAEEGQYEANKKVGVWNYYAPKGGLEQKYNWTTNKFELVKPMDGIKNFWIEENGVFVDKKPDELPVILGGSALMFKIFIQSMRYPADALRIGKQGEVLVSAVITPDGQMIDEKVEKGLGFGLDEEAIRIFKLIEGEWIPGKVNGKPVATKILMPFRFGLR